MRGPVTVGLVLAVLTACQGDVPSAKAALSKVIFKQKGRRVEEQKKHLSK